MDATTHDALPGPRQSFMEELTVISTALLRAKEAHVSELEQLRRENAALRSQMIQLPNQIGSPAQDVPKLTTLSSDQFHADSKGGLHAAPQPLDILPQGSPHPSNGSSQQGAGQSEERQVADGQVDQGPGLTPPATAGSSGNSDPGSPRNHPKPFIKIRDEWLGVAQALIETYSPLSCFKVSYNIETVTRAFRTRSKSLIMEKYPNAGVKNVIQLLCSLTTLHPVGVPRLIWNFVSLGFIFYDLLVLPMQAFDIEKGNLVQVCDWMVTFFWTLDVFVTLRTGYFIGARLEMRHRQIAIHYARTWMLCDIVVILIEWASRFAQVLGSASILRSSRALRSLRFLRLARVTKLMYFFEGMFDILNSNVHILIFTLFGLSVLLLLVIHFVTCLWYALGADASDGWVTYDPLHEHTETGNDTFFWYIASARWVIAQLNGRVDTNDKRNLKERFFTCIVGVILAVMAQAVFISFITKTMLDLSEIFSEKTRLQRICNQYLATNPLPPDLCSRIKRCVREYHDIHHEAQKEEHILKVLPKAVQCDILYEVRAPVVARHIFFNCLHFESPAAMRSISRTAIQTVSARKDEAIFRQGDECNRMLFTDRLEAMYSQIFDEGATGGKSEDTMSRIGSAMSSSPSARRKWLSEVSETKSVLQVYAADHLVKQVAEGYWISEAALWTQWVNLGTLTTTTHGFLYGIQPADLAKALKHHSELFVMANLYAQCIVGELQCQENMSDILAFEVQLISPIKLQVTIISATNLRNADVSIFTGTSDPYCVCKAVGLSGACSETRFRTPTINNLLDPVWNHSAEVGLNRQQSLRFEVWDDDFGPKSDTLLGVAALDAADFSPYGYEGDLDLVGAHKAQGSLRVKVEILKEV